MAEYAAPSGAPIWFDLMSSDTGGAEQFYGEIFGWETEEPSEEFGGYRNFTKNGKPVAGLSPAMEEAGPPNIWSVYLHSEDANATVNAVESAGGSIMVPPMPVGDEGTMMVATDPAGAVIGFWQSKDYARSVDFYRTVLGARIEEVGTGGDPDAVGPDHYGQIFYGDESYAGIMDASTLFPEEVPSFWQIYITVDDVAATVKQVESLGGEILMPGEDTPYGTLAAIKDPMGALICLGHPPAGM